MNRAQERDLRYHKWLDQIVEHLHEDRPEAAEVINNVPDEEIRNFAFYLAIHIERDLAMLSSQAADRQQP